MSAFQRSLENADPTNPTVASVSASLIAFKDFVMKSLQTLQKHVELLTRQVDHMETRARRKMLLVHGVDTAKLAVSRLQAVRDDFSVAEFERSNRLGRRGRRGKKPRAILIKFKETTTRDDVWFGKAALKGTGVTLGEFLTAPRHSAFMEARELFGVRNCWTSNGDVIVLGKDGVRRRANSVSDVRALPDAPALSDTVSASSEPIKASPGASVTASQTEKVQTRRDKLERRAAAKPRS